MATAKELYETQLKELPVVVRLQLVQLIIDDLVESAPDWVVESSEEWTDEDIEHIRRFSLAYAAKAYPDDDDEA